MYVIYTTNWSSIKAAVLHKHQSSVPRVFYCHFTSVIVCFVAVFFCYGRWFTTKGYQSYAPHTYKRYSFENIAVHLTDPLSFFSERHGYSSELAYKQPSIIQKKLSYSFSLYSSINTYYTYALSTYVYLGNLNMKVELWTCSSCPARSQAVTLSYKR